MSDDPMFTPSTKKNSIVSLRKQVKASKPVVLSHDIPPGTKFTFVDIAHSLATIDIDSKLNKFSALIDIANEWLQKNYLWKVENCETIGLLFKNEKLDPMDFGATQRLIRSNCDSNDCIELKGLRLWISRREDVPEMRKYVDIQTLAYQTYLPQSCRFYENQIGWQQLDDVIETINESINCRLITGQLLNIESVNYDATEEWLVDTECPKPKMQTSKQQTALRVYFVANSDNDCSLEDLSIFDFVPDVISANTPPKFESFSTLLYKMQDFLEENPEYRYLNSQSVDIKFKSIDELHTYYMVYINDIGYYLRILRLVCTKQSVVRHKPLERQMTFDNSCHPNEIKSDSDESKCRAVQTDKKPSSDTKVLANDRPVLNIETHYFEIMQNNNALHGPFYPVKRAIEEFMERPEWIAGDERRPEHRWKYLCSETITVLAKDELDIEKRVEMCLFSNRQSVFILMPRIYNIIRIYFDTSDVIPNRDYKSSNKALKKCQSESFEKKFKTSSRQQSLPVSAFQYIDSTNESLKTIKEKITKSFICSLM